MNNGHWQVVCGGTCRTEPSVSGNPATFDGVFRSLRKPVDCGELLSRPAHDRAAAIFRAAVVPILAETVRMHFTHGGKRHTNTHSSNH